MIKPKIYLDTSVISHLEADDKPEWRDDTRKLWEQLKRGEYEIVVSPVVYEELGRCEEDLGKRLFEYLNEIETTFVDETPQMDSLAKEYLKTGVLTEKSFDDCRHIAIASVHGCQYILSWNMKHFVKLKTMEMVENVNKMVGVFQPKIMTPTIFVEEGDEDE